MAGDRRVTGGRSILAVFALGFTPDVASVSHQRFALVPRGSGNCGNKSRKSFSVAVCRRTFSGRACPLSSDYSLDFWGKLAVLLRVFSSPASRRALTCSNLPGFVFRLDSAGVANLENPVWR